MILLKFIGYTRHEFSGDIYEFKDVAKQRGELCFNHFVDDVVYPIVRYRGLQICLAYPKVSS